MLKIRDDVDLKELEKYGMKHNPSSECYVDDYNYSVLSIYETGGFAREIIIDLLKTGFSVLGKDYEKINSNALNILYNLIKDGLVEKVKE